MTTPLAALSPAAHNAHSTADQDEQSLGGKRSLLVRQRRDHAELDRLLDALEAQPEDDALLNRLARLVFPHAYAEETVVWPMLRATLPDGEQLTLRNEQEHQQINALWAELERDRRPELVTEIAALLRQDVRDEEDLLLPRLQQAVTPAQLRRMGSTWAAVRRIAPTRPHAVVSRRPPGNLLSALPLTVLDRSRDGLEAGARAVPSLAPALTAASRALAGVAGVVEHLPTLRAGERAETRA